MLFRSLPARHHLDQLERPVGYRYRLALSHFDIFDPRSQCQNRADPHLPCPDALDTLGAAAVLQQFERRYLRSINPDGLAKSGAGDAITVGVIGDAAREGKREEWDED